MSASRPKCRCLLVSRLVQTRCIRQCERSSVDAAVLSRMRGLGTYDTAYNSSDKLFCSRETSARSVRDFVALFLPPPSTFSLVDTSTDRDAGCPTLGDKCSSSRSWNTHQFCNIVVFLVALLSFCLACRNFSFCTRSYSAPEPGVCTARFASFFVVGLAVANVGAANLPFCFPRLLFYTKNIKNVRYI